MSATADHLPDPELLATEWDLAPLVDGDYDARCRPPARQADERARGFAEPLRGQLAELMPPDERRDARARGHQRAGRQARPRTRRCGSPPTPPTRAGRAARRRCRSARRRSRRSCCSSSSSGPRSTTPAPTSCSTADGLDFCRHHLRSARRYRPHLLSEPEEKILAEKAISSHSAWNRLFGELVSALRVELDDERADARRGAQPPPGPDRETRRTAAEAVTASLEPGLRTRAFIYNTLAHDKSVEDRLRRYPHWLASRNLANEASDESVMALIEAVRGRYDIPQRWYRLKAKLLGVDQIADYDRAAPVLPEEVSFSFGEARELVLDTYEAFSPRGGEPSPDGSSTSTGSTRRSARTSAAARSAPTPSRACTRTCCSTSPPGAATC